MENIMTAFPSKYLKAADFEEPKLLTMDTVKFEEVGGELKPILFVKEYEKGIVINKTNAKTIARIYGTNPNGWTGKPIVGFSAMVEFKGDMVESIRFCAPKGKPVMISTGRVPTKAEVENPADGMDDEIPF